MAVTTRGTNRLLARCGRGCGLRLPAWLCYMKDMHIFERKVGGSSYRIAAQSLWDAGKGRSYARQAVLGPVQREVRASLAATQVVGEQRLGDVGAVVWVAERLGLVEKIDGACGVSGTASTPSVGEMVLAVAAQRLCAPGSKRALPEFLGSCGSRVSCLPHDAFSGQNFHRLAKLVRADALDDAQIAIAGEAVRRFGLSVDTLAFDTTNFDTYIATTTRHVKLARRGHAKSKRTNLRVVGLAVLASETGHVPLLHRTYQGNGSDQEVLRGSLAHLKKLHETLDEAEGGARPAGRTLVRDGGSWGEQLELDLDGTGYYTLVSLPLGHLAAGEALAYAAQRAAMKPLVGGGRACRLRTKVGDLDRTLVVVESEDLLSGQKRGIAAALAKAKKELCVIARRVAAGKLSRTQLEERVATALRREQLSEFMIPQISSRGEQLRFSWRVDAKKRRTLERTRLGRRVLCTDRHNWSTERIVRGFRGQWNVEELFRRAKKGGIAPWGPAHCWTDASLRLHTFCTAIGLTLASLVRHALGSHQSMVATLRSLRAVKMTLVRVTTGARGRRPTLALAPALDATQRRAAVLFDLERWAPNILSSSTSRAA